MRIFCDDGCYLSVERAERLAGDLRLRIEIRCRGFEGHIDAWIRGDVWVEFCNQLERLDRDRQGEAVVESMSPEEFRLRVRSIDVAGHMAIEGFLGSRHTHEKTLLTFSPMTFDPSTLPLLVENAKAIADHP